MFDHITLNVSDFNRSKTFYDQTLAPLGIKRLFDLSPEQTGGAYVAGYGDTRPRFWIAEDTRAIGPVHVAFSAARRADVAAFHAQALNAGGTDNGAPGLRPEYDANYYAAFVLDPDGHNIEAVCFGD